jgi:hypothetical protein
MAPIWHADPKSARGEIACSRVGALQDEADQVKAASTPSEVQEEAWTTRVDSLSAAVSALGNVCEGEDTADADAKMEDVHDAFHGLVELLDARE